EHLPVLETRTTGFRIHPFLARITRPSAWVLAAREVSEVLEPRLRELADPAAHQEAEFHMPTWDAPRRMPFYRVGDHRLWGLSYRILNPILRRIAEGGW